MENFSTRFPQIVENFVEKVVEKVVDNRPSRVLIPAAGYSIIEFQRINGGADMAKYVPPITDVDMFDYEMEVLPTRFTPKEAKAEYARLAKIANRNIRQIQASAEYSDAKAAQHDIFPENINGMNTVKQERQIYYRLHSVAKFVSKKTSSLAGLKKAEMKQLRTMRGDEDDPEAGYKWLNKSNIHEFGKFWEEVRKHQDVKQGDSERVALLFKKAKQKRIDSLTLAADFEDWLKHEQELDDMKRSNKKISSAEAKAKLGIE